MWSSQEWSATVLRLNFYRVFKPPVQAHWILRNSLIQTINQVVSPSIATSRNVRQTPLHTIAIDFYFLLIFRFLLLLRCFFLGISWYLHLSYRLNDPTCPGKSRCSVFLRKMSGGGWNLKAASFVPNLKARPFVPGQPYVPPEPTPPGAPVEAPVEGEPTCILKATVFLLN